MAIFKGSAVAMVTAFDNDSLNLKVQGEIIKHLLKNKVDAVVVCGTTGEPSTMSTKEKLDLIDFTLKTVNKAVPVIVGSGGNDTRQSVEFSLKCQDLGADALMVVTPYYNKCTQNGLLAHFKAIGEAVKLPIMAYNVPGRTGLNITPSTAAKLCDIKNIAAIKEASGDIHQISEVIRLTNGKADIYSGDDSLAVPAISLGAVGVVSVAGNVVCNEIHDMAIKAINGDFTAASKIHFKLAKLMQLLFCEVNPIPVKKAMEYLGFNVGIPRLPLTEMESESAANLKDEMVKLGLI